jgi:hypothetical protein
MIATPAHVTTAMNRFNEAGTDRWGVEDVMTWCYRASPW